MWKSKFSKNENNAWKYYPFTHLYHKWRSYDVWFLKYKVRQTECYVILDHFLPFNTSGDQKKITILKNWKQILGDIIILHMCAINVNRMMSGSWATEGDGQNFLSVWVILCPFTPLTICKIKILKKLKEKKKKRLEIIILQMCTINNNHIMYGSWDMECHETEFCVIFNHFLSYNPCNNLKN